MRASMVVIVSMAIVGVAGVVGFLVDRSWILLALGCVGLVGCVASLMSRQQMSAERAVE